MGFPFCFILGIKIGVNLWPQPCLSHVVLTLRQRCCLTLDYSAVLISDTGNQFSRNINLHFGLLPNYEPVFEKEKNLRKKKRKEKTEKKSRSSYLMHLSLSMMKKKLHFKKDPRSSDWFCESLIVIGNYYIRCFTDYRGF